MIQVSFHGAHIGVKPFVGDDGSSGKALVITDGGMVVMMPLGEDACREIAGELLGGLALPKLELPGDLARNGSGILEVPR